MSTEKASSTVTEDALMSDVFTTFCRYFKVSADAVLGLVEKD